MVSPGLWSLKTTGGPFVHIFAILTLFQFYLHCCPLCSNNKFKQQRRNKFKTEGINDLWAKWAEQILNCCTQNWQKFQSRKLQKKFSPKFSGPAASDNPALVKSTYRRNRQTDRRARSVTCNAGAQQTSSFISKYNSSSARRDNVE